MGSLETWTLPSSLEKRVVDTLRIADRWGYGLAGEDVARLLHGGPADPSDVESVLASSRGVMYRGGVAALSGRGDLIEKSLARRLSNGGLAALYFEIAEEFARDLLRHNPFVRAIAVCGSTASGGLEAGDDIDFNLFAEDGTKYVVYLSALLLGLKYSVLHGRPFRGGASLLALLPKVTCVNVVWTESHSRPFLRQDASLAFELLRSVPIAGTAHYARTLESNPWLGAHFPQIFTRVVADRVGPQRPTLIAGAIGAVARFPLGRRVLEQVCRGVVAAIHRVVRLTRERDPEAMARHTFLRRVKFPYDVLQD